MKPTRLTYCCTTLLVVLLGILSRKINTIPLGVGDTLYAVMVYFGCRIFFINNINPIKIIMPLMLCYLIEVQQLYNAFWLIALRNTTLGHYALGQGFLWSDLVFYTLGVLIAYELDSLMNSLK